MLRNQEIIENLSIEQKLSLLADINALANLPLSESVLAPKMREFAKVCLKGGDGAYTPYASLVNAWDIELLSKVAGDVVARAKESKVTALELPAVNVKTTPYSTGFSEDPYLSGATAATLVGACASQGMKTCVKDPAVFPLDKAYSDILPNERAIEEYFKKPFRMAFRQGADTVRTRMPVLQGEYETVNPDWLEKIKKKRKVIYDCKTPQQTLDIVKSGEGFCRGGSFYVLKEAYDRYRALQQAFDAGSITINELDTECAQGGALRPEEIDAAVDEIVEYAKACADIRDKKSSEEKGLLLRAAEESIVLLKNEKDILPLKKGVKIGVVGDLAKAGASLGDSVSEYAKTLPPKSKIKYVGYARGYDKNAYRSDGLIENALKLAKEVDVLIVVLGWDEAEAKRAANDRTCKLPANQLALLDALSKQSASVVTIVSGGVPDVAFDEQCKALLLADVSATKSAEALFNILLGKTCPSGRLANTCYVDTDAWFFRLRAYKDAKRNKIGVFYGYRQYDTAGLKVKYPFGYGLSYTQFEYGGITNTGNGFEFTVRNKGRCEGMETVQLYVGKKDSALLRPTKELKAFVKVSLRAGESKRICINKNDLDLGVYDVKKGKTVTELGSYELYVCASVKDVRQKKTFYAGTEKIEAKKENYSDYLQTYSNIVKDGYTLDLPCSTPKVRSGFRKFMRVWAALSVCAAIVYAYFGSIRWLPDNAALHLVATALFALPVIWTLALTAKTKNKIRKDLEKSMKEKMKQREEWNVDDLADEIPYEKLFEDEFAVTPIEKEEVKQEEEKKNEAEKKVLNVPFDREFPLTRVCEEFLVFANERGVKTDVNTAKRFFASLAASRLVIVKTSENELYEKFLSVLGQYFGVRVTRDSVENADADVLYAKKSYADAQISAATRSIAEAAYEENKLRLIAVGGLRSANCKEFLAPVLRYVDQPLRETEITVAGEESEKTYVIPENVWLLLSLAGNEKLAEVPKYVLDMASVLELPLQEGMQSKTKPVVVAETDETPEQETAAEAEETAETPVLEEMPIAEAEEIPVIEQEDIPVIEQEDIPVMEREEIPVLEREEIPVMEQEEIAVMETETAKTGAGMKVVEVEVETEKTPVKALVYTQFAKLVEYACRDYPLDEVLWKRVDKLEEFVDKCNAYRIENKQWQRMERFASVYLASGGEAEEALDSLISQHLIYGMLPCVGSSKKPLEEKFSHTLENLFGEGHVPQVLKALKESEFDA